MCVLFNIYHVYHDATSVAAVVFFSLDLGFFCFIWGSAKYKKYRNKVSHLLEINKKSYYQSQFLSCRNDSGKMWKLINSLISSKKKSSCRP